MINGKEAQSHKIERGGRGILEGLEGRKGKDINSFLKKIMNIIFNQKIEIATLR